MHHYYAVAHDGLCTLKIAKEHIKEDRCENISLLKMGCEIRR